MKLTREQAIKEHRKMWNWLAEHPEKDKDDYLELNDFEYVENECFCVTIVVKIVTIIVGEIVYAIGAKQMAV